MPPAAEPTSGGRTASPSTQARPIITVPHLSCSMSSGRCAAARTLSDDVELQADGALLPHPLRRRQLVRLQRRRRAACAPRWPASPRRRGRRTSVFWKRPRMCYQLGFDRARQHRLQHASATCCGRAARRWSACAAGAASTRWCAATSRTRSCASSMSFHPLLIGGNPLSVTCIYSLINTLERRFGVHSAMGGTGAIDQAAWSGCWQSSERRHPLRRRGEAVASTSSLRPRGRWRVARGGPPA